MFNEKFELPFTPILCSSDLNCPGVAFGKVIVYAQVIDPDPKKTLEIIQDLIHSYGQTAGTITLANLVKGPVDIALLYQFLKSNLAQ